MIEDVAHQLGYAGSENWVVGDDSDPATAHIHRAASRAGVKGSYLYQTSPDTMRVLPPRIAMHVASADTPDQAREIHRRLWNLGSSPFVLVVLPDHVRVYSGFSYNQEMDSPGLIAKADLSFVDIRSQLADFHAAEIDSGRIWTARSRDLRVGSRVDFKLLRNLKELGRQLTERTRISTKTSHALIGKYIYLSYLKHRNILSEEWLLEHGIDGATALGRDATAGSFRLLVEAVEGRFNGQIFPLEFSGPDAPGESAIRYVASVFAGDEIVSGQLALDFAAYDFSYIPIELLSSIYQQFLHERGEGREEGVVYTPEPLADYVLCEVNYTNPLRLDTKVLDPCCGSGVFLVLAYRRLVELHHQMLGRRPTPGELKGILLDSIYGVERSADACYVTEFSLILTLLGYLEPPELDKNEDFQFPKLHNVRIFEMDFFDDDCPIHRENLRFDWILGNPPWIELSPGSPKGQEKGIEWIRKSNRMQHLVARYRLCEAVTWRAGEMLGPGGTAGFVIHATSLTNELSEGYRRTFFHHHEMKRVTNFSNLAYILFPPAAVDLKEAGTSRERPQAPAATIVYRISQIGQEKSPIIHYGPFVVNQVPIGSAGHGQRVVWSITINEGEIKVIDPDDADSGDGKIWKYALWGTYRDRRAIQRLERLFPKRLNQFCRDREGWDLNLGLQLRDSRSVSEQIEHEAALAGMRVLSADLMNKSRFRFSVPAGALVPIEDERCYIRKVGGRAGLNVIHAPHLVLSVDGAIYSDEDFVLPHPRIGLKAPPQDRNYLQALSIIFSSSVFRYLMFFRTSSWGISVSQLSKEAAEEMLVPPLNDDQLTFLTKVYESLAREERARLGDLAAETQLALSPRHEAKRDVRVLALRSQEFESEAQTAIDKAVEETLDIPETIAVMAREFMGIRYQFIKGKFGTTAVVPPDAGQLLLYGDRLRNELDVFAGAIHRVDLAYSDTVIGATVELTKSSQKIPVRISAAEAIPFAVWEELNHAQSQWVYVQRGLRMFEGPRARIFRSARLMDWTQTQAILDADDIIAEVLGGGPSR